MTSSCHASRTASKKLFRLNFSTTKASAAGLVLLALCLLAGPARAALATADLAGRWQGFIQYKDSLGSSSTGLFSLGLLLDIDSGGHVTGGNFGDDDALGSLNLAGNGALSGTLVDHDTTSQDATWNLGDARMNGSKDILAGVVALDGYASICGRFALMRVSEAGATAQDLAGTWNGFMLDPSAGTGGGSYTAAAVGRHAFTIQAPSDDVVAGRYAYINTNDTFRHGDLTGAKPTVDGQGVLAGNLTCTIDGGIADVDLTLAGAGLNRTRDGIIGYLPLAAGWIAYKTGSAETPAADIAGRWRVYSWETTGDGLHRPVVADLVLVPSGPAGMLTVVRGSYRYPATGDTGSIVSGSMSVAAGLVTSGSYTTGGGVVATIDSGALNMALDAGAMILSNDVIIAGRALCNHSILIRLQDTLSPAATALMLLD